MRRHVALTLSVVAGFAAAVCAAPAAARAAQPLHNTIIITPSSGCGLLTAYVAGTGLPAWSSPAPPCGTGPFTLGFNQGNTPPPATLSRTGGVGMAGSALLGFAASVPEGARMGYQITAPPGITITQVLSPASQLQNIANGRGWIGFTYWKGGTAPVHPNGTAVDAAASGPLNTPYWGIELRCVQSVCTGPGEIQLSQITVSATEESGPSITPVVDPSSLWTQAGPGRWIWNAAGNAWSLPVTGADLSGVCTLSLQVGTSAPIADPSLPAPDNSSWQQCQPASWTAAVDTRDYVSGAGQLPVTLQATNAAGLPNAPMSETLNVDNEPVSVSLSLPDDPNPTVWVNHAVTVDAAPSTGPSGLGGMSCGVDGAAAQSYPAGGLTVDGDGVSTVTCTAWNNAVDPQGNHNSGTSSTAVHIDEAPPSISFEPVNPNDPTGLVADTSDSESGVAGGSIEMAPAGTGNWTSLPATFTGTQVLAHFNDAGLHGVYSFRIESCDNVGNCASSTRTLMLPVRVGAVSEVSIQKAPATRCASAPAKHAAAASAARRSLPGWREVWQSGTSALRLARGGGVDRLSATDLPSPIPAGNAFASSSAGDVMLPRSLPHSQSPVATTASSRPKPAAARQGCGTPTARLATRARVGFGRRVTVHGLLMSTAGLPVAGQPVTVLTAPDNGSNAFTEAAAAITGPDGRWRATLPPGPSRIIEASYPGSPTILPAIGSATVITPAKIVLRRVTPDRTPWGRTVRITGRVLGGYIPASSKLLRLDLGVVGIPGLSKIQGIPNVSPDGTFTTTYTFARGFSGVVRFWLMVSSLPEADFPFSPAHSARWIVTVGVPARTVRRSPAVVRRGHRRGRAHDRHPGHRRGRPG
jgi:hypothetical protein